MTIEKEAVQWDRFFDY